MSEEKQEVKESRKMFDVSEQLLGKTYEPWENSEGNPVTVCWISGNAVGSAHANKAGTGAEQLDEGQAKKRGKLWRKLMKHMKKIEAAWKAGDEPPKLHVNAKEQTMIEDCVLRGMDPFIYLQIYEFYNDDDLGDE